MPLFQRVEQISSVCAPHVREFQKLYDFHSLRRGAPQDFLQLAPKLASSEGFRLDFSDLVRTTRERERGTLTAAEMLTILGVAIGGPGVARAEVELYESAGTVQVLLAGVGGWSDAGPEWRRADGAGRAEAHDVERGGLEGRRPVAAPEPPRRSREERSGRAPERAAESDASPEMMETLARLELASLQLKIYLDDIDRRIGRIEPNLDDLNAVVHSSTEFLQGVKRDAGLPETGDRPRSSHTDARWGHNEAIAALSREEPADSWVEPEPDADSVGESWTGEVAGAVPAGAEVDWEEFGRPETVPSVAAPAAKREEPVKASGDHAANNVVGDPAVQAVPAAAVWVSNWTAKEPVAASDPAPVAEPVGARLLDEPATEEVLPPKRKLQPVLLPEASVAPREVRLPAAGAKEALPVVSVVPLREERGSRRPRWVWVAGVALLVGGAGGAAYLYGPWSPSGRVQGAAAATGQVSPGEGSATTGGDVDGSANVLANGAAVGGKEVSPAVDAVRGVTTPVRGKDVRGVEISASRREARQTGSSGAGDAPLTAAAATTPVNGTGGAAPGTGLPMGTAFGAEPPKLEATPAAVAVPKDRVEGARAAEVVRAPSIEEVRTAAPVERSATGPNAGVREVSMTNTGAAPSPAPGRGGNAGGGDLPRASAAKPDLAAMPTGGEVVQAPSPIYPQQAKQLGIEGKVVVRVSVGVDGRVTGVQILDGPVLLHQSAEDAVRRRRYKPFVVRGAAAPFQTMVTLNYRLAR